MNPSKSYNHKWITIQEKYENHYLKPSKLQTKAVKQPIQQRTTMEPGCSSTTHLERLSKPANNSLADQTTYEERMLKDCTFSPRING